MSQEVVNSVTPVHARRGRHRHLPWRSRRRADLDTVASHAFPPGLTPNAPSVESQTPRWSSTSKSAKLANSCSSWRPARSPGRSSPPVPTRPTTPMRESADRIACSGRKLPSTPYPFDGEAARAHGRIYAAEVAGGRKARGARALDLLIAAAACARDLPVYTRNPDDFQGLRGLAEIVTDRPAVDCRQVPASHPRESRQV